jgi:hypothetical protein
MNIVISSAPWITELTDRETMSAYINLAKLMYGESLVSKRHTSSRKVYRVNFLHGPSVEVDNLGNDVIDFWEAVFIACRNGMDLWVSPSNSGDDINGYAYPELLNSRCVFEIAWPKFVEHSARGTIVAKSVPELEFLSAASQTYDLCSLESTNECYNFALSTNLDRSKVKAILLKSLYGRRS